VPRGLAGSCLPAIGPGIGFLLWISYGIAARNLALIVPNTVALLIGASTIAVAFRLGQPASRR
jgi:hypothetical protein